MTPLFTPPILLALLIALQVLDMLTTYYALRHGLGREGNGPLARLMARVGVLPALALVKGALVLLLVAGREYLLPQALAALVVLYAAIVINNLRVILRARKARGRSDA